MSLSTFPVLWCLSGGAWSFSITLKTALSSANILEDDDLIISERSLMKVKSSSGPSTVPCCLLFDRNDCIHLLICCPLHCNGPACAVAVHEGLWQKLWQSPVEWQLPVSLWLWWRRFPRWWLGVESRKSIACGNRAPLVCTLWTSRPLVCSWMLGGGILSWNEGLRMPPSSPEVLLLGRGIVGTGLLV